MSFRSYLDLEVWQMPDSRSLTPVNVTVDGVQLTGIRGSK